MTSVHILTTYFCNIHFNIMLYINVQHFKSPTSKKAKHFHPLSSPHCLINASGWGRLPGRMFYHWKYRTHIEETSHRLICRGCRENSLLYDDENPRHAKSDVTNKSDTEVLKINLGWRNNTDQMPALDRTHTSEGTDETLFEPRDGLDLLQNLSVFGGT